MISIEVVPAILISNSGSSRDRYHTSLFLFLLSGSHASFSASDASVHKRVSVICVFLSSTNVPCIFCGKRSRSSSACRHKETISFLFFSEISTLYTFSQVSLYFRILDPQVGIRKIFSFLACW